MSFLQYTALFVCVVLGHVPNASSQTLPCQLTGGTSCPTMICPNTAVNYTCNVGSFAGNTQWGVPSVGGCSVSPLLLAQGPPGSGLSCLTSSSSAVCGPFTVTNTPPLIFNTYCLTSTLSVVVTPAMNGLVVSCSSYQISSPFTTTSIGNASISVVASPSTPNITSLTSTYSDQLTVTWTSVPTATSYSVSINGSSPISLPANANTYTFTGLANNTVYTVSVVAINCAGNSISATLTNKTSNGPATPTTFTPPVVQPSTTSPSASQQPTVATTTIPQPTPTTAGNTATVGMSFAAMMVLTLLALA